jgi:hypothetical protein
MKVDKLIDELIKPPRVIYARATFAARVTGRVLKPTGYADREKMLAARLQLRREDE